MSAGPSGSAARAIAPQPTPRHAHAVMVLMITCTPCGKERVHCSLCLNQGSCIGATGAANDGGAAVPAVTLTELILQRERTCTLCAWPRLVVFLALAAGRRFRGEARCLGVGGHFQRTTRTESLKNSEDLRI